MITVLGGLAEFERHLILARSDEGRMRAKARGVRFGRKLKLTKHQQQEALARREAGEPLTEIGKSYNVSHSTISRLASVGASRFAAKTNRKASIDERIDTGVFETPVSSRPFLVGAQQRLNAGRLLRGLSTTNRCPSG
jgi:hypothetical protein